MQSVALITGASGQDGWYLGSLLKTKGYMVHGTTRRYSSDGLSPDTNWHSVDLNDAAQVARLLRDLQPDEIYHLAAHSSVGGSGAWDRSTEVLRANVLATDVLLAAMMEFCPSARFLLAGSCLQFEGAAECPQTERTPPSPRSPYGVSKAAAAALVEAYRRTHGSFACTAILYNHESHRRPDCYVTAKIVRGLSNVASGKSANLTLNGDLRAIRDFSFAGDIADGMWRMLQQESPRDLILASGVGTSIMEFALAVGDALLLPRRVVEKSVHSYFSGPTATPLVGDPSLAAEVLGWRTTDLPSLAKLLIGGRV